MLFYNGFGGIKSNARAVGLQKQSVFGAEKLGKNHARTLQTVKHMISCYEMQEKVEQAITYSIRAHTISDAIFGELSAESSAIVLRLVSLIFKNSDSVTSLHIY